LNRRNGGPDGLLGLGFPIVSAFDAPTLLENLASQHQTTDSIFALWLKGDNGESGQLTLGGINPILFTGTPIYAPVSQDGFWQIKLSSFKVGDEVLTGPAHATLDSVCLEFYVVILRANQV
jgi:Eukaryotic aspartyl protease